MYRLAADFESRHNPTQPAEGTFPNLMRGNLAMATFEDQPKQR